MTQSSISIDHEELADFCREHGVSRFSMFGSVLRNDFDPEGSDVDLLVEFAPGVHRGLFKLVSMQQSLSGMFGRTVDLNTPGSLSSYFRDEVLADAVVIYDAT